jgi:uncharacterized protein
LKIHLDSVRSGPFEWEESLEFAPAEVGCDPTCELSPVAVRGRLSEAEPDLWLDLEVAFRVSQPCDRCGRPAPAELRSRAKLLVVRRPASAGRDSGGEVELSEDELGVLEVAGGEFESEPLVAEQVQLELPPRPLCRDDCRGLCPICGGDRNERECDCEREASDPRWSALAELRGRLRAPN